MHRQDDEVKQFTFKRDWNLQQCKVEICEAFEIPADMVKEYTLFRLDGFGEPQFAVKKEKAGFLKNNISSGDTLALKSNKDLTLDEKILLGVHLTTTGLPDDCMFLGNIDASKETTLLELKE